MRIVNPDKMRSRILAQNDLLNILTQLAREESRIRQTASLISQTAGQMPSGRDSQLLDDCKIAMDRLSRAAALLTAARNTVGGVDVMEEVPDDGGS